MLDHQNVLGDHFDSKSSVNANYVIILSGFPLYFGSEIQGLFKDFQGPWSYIFKNHFSTEVSSVDSITAIFNIYFCDYGTVLVDKNKTWQLLANLAGKIPGRLKDRVVDKKHDANMKYSSQ